MDAPGVPAPAPEPEAIPPAVSPPPIPAFGATASQALADERVHIDALRAADEHAARHNPHGLPVGLALSGGGIRSATICLGAVQALAETRALRRFDYLSTVSGGGYIGCWLSALLRQRGQKKPPGHDALGEVERLLSPAEIRERDEEPAEIAFLRAYSNYLTPRLGLFSADTLAALTGYLRNLLLSLLLAVLSTGLVLAVLHGLMMGLEMGIERPGVRAVLREAARGMLAVGAVFAAFLLTLQSVDLRARIPDGKYRDPLLTILQLLQDVFSGGMLPLMAGAMLFAGGFLEANLRFDVAWTDVAAVAAGTLALFGVGALAATLIVDFACELRHAVDRVRFTVRALTTVLAWRQLLAAMIERNWREALRFTVAGAGCALVAHQLLRLAGHLPEVSPAVALFRGPAVATGIAAAVAMVWLGAVGTTYAEPTREWLSRLMGTLVGLSLAWLAIGAVVINARPAMYWLARGQFLFAFQTAWILPTAGVLLMATVWMQRRPAVDPSAPPSGRRWVDLAVPAACGLVTVLFMCTMTIAFQEMLVRVNGTPALRTGSDGNYASVLAAHLADLGRVMAVDLAPIDPPPGSPLWVRVQAWAAALWHDAPVASMFEACALGTWVAFRYIDVNVFSLQNLYRNRLVRCYLGAARHGERMQNPYAGFDPADDLELASLARQRPYHLVNAALNITQGEDLAWQQRQAASFCFSPLWCGYWLEAANLSGLVAEDRTQGGYVRTSAYACEPAWGQESGGVMVGTAMATSGAAVSPQMGFASHGLLAFVLTLFNVRLGRWFPNTAPSKEQWRYGRHSPRFAGGWYLSELLGRTNEKSSWVYLSDGGHFDNLGVYELVRRRCRFIVVVDAGADPQMSFGDLGNCVRKCRVDLGVSIRLDLREFGLESGVHGRPPRPKCAHVAGKVYYPSSGSAPKFTGDILYIKSSLPTAQDEPPADILSFLAEHPQFPHQTTADQWFTESQFESYRQLGYWITKRAMPAAQGVFGAIEHPASAKGKGASPPAAPQTPSTPIVTAEEKASMEAAVVATRAVEAAKGDGVPEELGG